MSRYANRPQQQSYQRPQSYYEQDLGNYPNVGYADDDDGTMVQTDVSALPPRHSAGPVRASWGPNDTRYFDGDAPPDTVERERPRRSGAASLAVPSSGGRPRAHSFDGGRPQQQPQYERERYAAPPSRQAYPAPPPARQAYRAPAPPPAREPAYRAPPPQAAYRRAPVPTPRYYADEPADDSDDDKFTAVGTGVATDLDFEDEEDPAGFPAETYGGRGDPRNGDYQRRSVGGFSGYGNDEGSLRAQPAPNVRGGYGVPPEPQRNARRGPGAGYADEDLGPGGGGRLAPPPGRGQRPTSPGGVRPGRYESPVPVRGPPPPDVPEDSPEERNLIRLLKDMNFSVALKDFHDTFGIGVQKTIVAADGFGHAYCKIHCKKLPRHSDIDREPHLKKHWLPMAGNRWQFRTESHKVEILFKSAAVGAYETAAKYGAAPPRR